MNHLFTLISVFALLFTTCEGPQGPPGFDGFDGFDGQDGALLSLHLLKLNWFLLR